MNFTQFIPVLSVIAILAGIVLLAKGADWLVRGATLLALMAGVSPLVVGLTVVAFGTSLPELVTSLIGGSAITIGNVAGSNLLNLGLILGLTAILSPLVCQPRFLRFGVYYMAAGGLAMLWVCYDGTVGRIEGTVLLVGLVAYVIVSVRRGQAVLPPEVTEQNAKTAPRLPSVIFQILIGLVLLTAGGRALVWGAVEIAEMLEISERVIALTLVAGGTSLPELATSLVAARRGQGDIALGNIVGSNIFNIFGILGFCALVRPISVPARSEELDIPVMALLQFLAWPMLLACSRLGRAAGAGLLLFYACYLAVLLVLR